MAKVRTKTQTESTTREYPLASVSAEAIVAEVPSRYQLRLSFEKPQKVLIRTEPFVEETLFRLLKRDLTFKGEKTTYASHNLHAFAAKFPPQLPRLFIYELTQPGESVLDPMMGSGTTSVEAMLTGRCGIGIDLDPLASLIAKVKTTPLSLPRCAQAGAAVLGEATKNVHNVTNDELSHFYSSQAVEFFHYWFEEYTISELFSLVKAIRKVEEPDVRAFLQVVFSSCIITKTAGLTRARDLAHSRPHRDPNKQIKQSALEVFGTRLGMAIDSLEDIVEAPAPACTIRADARSLPLASDSIHLIVTSPPYAANAIDYMRAHKFSLMWLRFEPKILTGLRRQYVGAEIQSPTLEVASETAQHVLQALQRKDKRRAAVVAYYFRDMEIVLREMLRVLAVGRAAVLVVGSSTIKGIGIKAPMVFAELATSVGFRVVGVAKREIVRDARMMPVSRYGARKGIEARMHEEGVIGLIKPPRGETHADARRDHGVCDHRFLKGRCSTDMTTPHIASPARRRIFPRIFRSLLIGSVLFAFACGGEKTPAQLQQEAQALEREGKLKQALEIYEYAARKYPDSKEAAAMGAAVIRVKKALRQQEKAAKARTAARTVRKKPAPRKAPKKRDARPSGIVMGRSVSGIRLGASQRAVKRILGKPSGVEDNTDIGGGLRWHFYAKGITVYFKDGEHVYGVYLFGDEGNYRRYRGRTEKGIGIGSPYDAVIEAYGPPDVPGTANAWHIGEWRVSFDRDKGGNRNEVGRITILKRD